MILGFMTVLALGVGGGRVEGVQLVTDGPRLLIQVRVVGAPSWVSVQREGETIRVSLKDAALGGPFSGGDRFQWAPVSSASPSGAPSLDSLTIQKDFGGVSLRFRPPPNAEIELQRAPAAVMIVLHEARVRTPPVAAASPVPAPIVEANHRPVPPEAVAEVRPASPTEEPRLEKHSEPAPAAELAPEAAAPSAPRRAEETPELIRKLFPASSASGPTPLEPPAPTPAAGGTDTRVASADVLYHQLFPTAPSEPQETPPVAPSARTGPRTMTLGFLTLHPALRTSYIRGDTTLGSPQPVTTGYAQIEPRLDVETTFGDSHLMLGYAPAFRAFSAYDLINQPTHNLTGVLDFFAGSRLRVKASDSFVSGVVETQAVDPGREYFFDLSRFKQNTVAVNGSVEVASRISVEVGGSLNTVRFDQPGGFFSYDARAAMAGLGFELTPTLKATLGYAYDRVPPPVERPVAEATAHSVQAILSGEVTPLINGQLMVGYRDQTSPQAPESGRRYRGVVASGLMSRALGERSWLLLSVSRATPVSNFEDNAYYVSTAAGVDVAVPLPFGLSLDAGVEHRWNDYRTSAAEIGAPRHDRILGLRAGLRRPLGSLSTLSVYYRRDRRRSNLDEFQSTANGLIVQLDLNSASGTARR